MIVGISMVKDEDDFVETTIQHMLAEGVDRFLIFDNNSTDHTRTILERFPQVEVLDDPEVGYFQSAKMSFLAEQARNMGAEWVIPFDADEIWFRYQRDGSVADFLSHTKADVVWANTFEHPPTALVPSPMRARDRKSLRKVAFRAWPNVWVAQGNHNVNRPGKRVVGLEIREFQYRTLAQFARKVRNGKAAYDATDLPEGEGAHWREMGAMTDTELLKRWHEMVNRTDTIYDPAPIRC